MKKEFIKLSSFFSELNFFKGIYFFFQEFIFFQELFFQLRLRFFFDQIFFSRWVLCVFQWRYSVKKKFLFFLEISFFFMNFHFTLGNLILRIE